MQCHLEKAYRERLPTQGTHPNQPVALVSPHRFYQSRNGAIFPFRASCRTLALTCDPLLGAASLEEAIADFDQAHSHFGLLFAGITGSVARALAARGFSVFKIGEEPWIDLEAFQPKGNRGKGIRAARNQALRAGCVAEEWSEAEFRARRREVEEVFREWRGLTFISLEGGIMATGPFAEIPGRRYFTVSRDGHLEAALVVTPIRSGESYYLEDLVYRRKCARGVQELATLAALEALHTSGARKASLGMVLLRRIERAEISTFNPQSLGFRILSRVVALAYNAEGQELFRKRFPVACWEPTYLAFRGPKFLRRLGLGMYPAAALVWSLLAMVLDLDPTFMWPWG